MLRCKHMKKITSAFTLVEIMVVVFIIALLLAMAVVQGIGLRKMANDSAAEANLKGIASSFEVFAAAHDGRYAPGSQANLQFLVDGKYFAQDLTAAGSMGNFNYIAAFIDTMGYDIRAIAVNPVLATHNYQVSTGGVLKRSNTSASGDTDFKSF